MIAHLLPVSGLYMHPADGARAAQVLREKGFGPVAIRPLADIDLSLLPISQKEANARLNWMIGFSILGFFALGALGWFLGNTIHMGLGVIAALSLAFLGMLAAILLVDRPAERHRRYRQEGGVLLTVHCTKEEEEQVSEALLRTGAVEVKAVTAAGA